jgi:tRNA(Ile)-lysidine synthase
LKNISKGLALQRILNNNFNLKNISNQTIDRILALEEKPPGTVCEINKKFIVLKDRDKLIFSRKIKDDGIFKMIRKEGDFEAGGFKVSLKKVTKRQVKINSDNLVEFLDWEKIPSILYLRTWKQGDNFQPLGMNSSVKLSDFFTNNKIPLLDKKKILLLATKSDIVWVCGMRINEKYKITEQSSKYLKVEIKQNKKY